MSDDQYVPIGIAAKRIGISQAKLRRIAATGLLPVYELPSDGRVRLVRVSDLATLKQPRPVRKGEPTATAA